MPVNPWLAMRGDYLRSVVCALVSIAVVLVALLLERGMA
jgi:hypothetical protein